MDVLVVREPQHVPERETTPDVSAAVCPRHHLVAGEGVLEPVLADGRGHGARHVNGPRSGCLRVDVDLADVFDGDAVGGRVLDAPIPEVVPVPSRQVVAHIVVPEDVFPGPVGRLRKEDELHAVVELRDVGAVGVQVVIITGILRVPGDDHLPLGGVRVVHVLVGEGIAIVVDRLDLDLIARNGSADELHQILDVSPLDGTFVLEVDGLVRIPEVPGIERRSLEVVVRGTVTLDVEGGLHLAVGDGLLGDDGRAVGCILRDGQGLCGGGGRRGGCRWLGGHEGPQQGDAQGYGEDDA